MKSVLAAKTGFVSQLWHIFFCYTHAHFGAFSVQADHCPVSPHSTASVFGIPTFCGGKIGSGGWVLGGSFQEVVELLARYQGSRWLQPNPRTTLVCCSLCL